MKTNKGKKKYSEQTLEALRNGYEYGWIIDDTLTRRDINLFDELCDRIREDNHDGACWDLLKTFDQFAHEYCERVKKGKPSE